MKNPLGSLSLGPKIFIDAEVAKVKRLSSERDALRLIKEQPETVSNLSMAWRNYTDIIKYPIAILSIDEEIMDTAVEISKKHGLLNGLTIIKRGNKMKTCYMCKGEVKLSLVDVEVKSVVVKDVPAEVCIRCGEKYFDTKTASFIQEITGCIDEKKKGYIVDMIRSAYHIKGAVEA